MFLSNHSREFSSYFILAVNELRCCLTEEEFKLVQAQLGYDFLNSKQA